MRKYLLLFFVAVLFISCEKEQDPTITTAPVNHFVNFSGGTISLMVSSNADWSAECEETNVTVEPMSGRGDMTVRVTVPENKEGVTKSVRVTFTAKGNEKTSTAKAVITVDAAPYISLSRSSSTIPAQGGGVQVDLSSNGEWSASCSDPSVVVTPSAGNKNALVTISLDENTTSVERKFSVTFAMKEYPDKKTELIIIQSDK